MWVLRTKESTNVISQPYDKAINLKRIKLPTANNALELHHKQDNSIILHFILTTATHLQIAQYNI